MRKNQGFSLIEVIIVVIVVAVVGALGVVGYNAWKNNGTAQQANTSNTTNIASKVPDVKSTSDLDAVAKTLDTANLSSASADSQQLSSQASGF
jgi:prepilin-type N-terminal cleavage/methylation domain-containing protein